MIFNWGKKKKKKAAEVIEPPKVDVESETNGDDLTSPVVDEPAALPPETAEPAEEPSVQSWSEPDPIVEPSAPHEPETPAEPISEAAPSVQSWSEPDPIGEAAAPPEPETPADSEPVTQDGQNPEAEPEPIPEREPEDKPAKKPGLFSRLASGLKRSSSRLGDGVTALFTKRKLDDEALEDLEDLLLTADLGAGPAARVIARLAKDKFDKEVTDTEIKQALADVVADTLRPHEADLDLSGASPQVILFVGVNGAGKTTTLGKIAAMIKAEGHDVVLAAGDTFRAAAIEQIQVWGERTGCSVVSKQLGADAAGLVYEAYERAKAEGADVLLVDTAGRLQNKAALMDELKKIVRVLKKHDETAPHHVLLVLDATVGQNALSQAAAFTETAGVTGLVMTKLDGTAKGGVLVALADKHAELPIYFTGVGERVEDLAPFSADDFARALAGVSEETEPA